MTHYTDIFQLFINKINDHQLISLEEEKVEQICCIYLKSAITKFKKCRTDLKRDDVARCFLNILSDTEKEIIANLLIVEWLTPKVQNTTNLKQYMGDSDFKFFSQANHLDALNRIRKSAIEEADGLILEYSWDDDTGLGGLV